MLIIVSGLPGSGKSYFASALSERLGAEYVNSDQVRKKMQAMGKYSFEDKLDVYRTMASFAEEALRHGKTVVADATFYHREMREIFMALARTACETICFIEIGADEKIIRERLQKPRPDSEADHAVYKQLKTQYEALPVAHLTLQSRNDNINIMLEKAIAYIKKVNERKTS